MFLQTEFEKCGRVVDVYNTGKGFAFVTFDRKEDAATAITELDGANVCGQSIKVGITVVMIYDNATIMHDDKICEVHMTCFVTHSEPA